MYHESTEQRVANAKKAAETRRLRGENSFAHLTPAQRSERAKKAAETRKKEGLKPFGGKHHHGPLGHHTKAYGRKRPGAFSHVSREQRVANAKKAAATRRARGEL